MTTVIKTKIKIHSKSEGFTLIELLVAMVIGMVVVGAAISMFRTTVSHQRTVTFNSQLQEEAFFLSHVFRQQIAQIGYRPIDNLKVDGRFLPIENRQTAFPEEGTRWEPGQTFDIVMFGDWMSILYFRYYGASSDTNTADSSVFDCLGNPVSEGSIKEDKIYVFNNTISCYASRPRYGSMGAQYGTIFGNQDSAVLLEKVAYEIAVDDNGDGAIDRNLDASIATDLDFTNTKQLTVRFLLSTPDNIATQKTPYVFNGVEYESTDRKIRLETEISMALRN